MTDQANEPGGHPPQGFGLNWSPKGRKQTLPLPQHLDDPPPPPTSPSLKVQIRNYTPTTTNSQRFIAQFIFSY